MKSDVQLPSGDLLVVGALYYVKMRGGGQCKAVYNGMREHLPFGGATSRATKVYHFTNTRTGRHIITRSKVVILRPV